jgi:uncharacterized repeat protein (TIGR03803 family)
MTRWILGMTVCLTMPNGTAVAQVVTAHSFGAGTDGQSPSGNLIQTGSTYFGMTPAGGTGLDGTVFQFSTNGAGVMVMHSFMDGSNDGRNPNGSLVQFGSTLAGMTEFGGFNGNGVVFNIGTDATNFAVTHRFAGGATDGAVPRGSLAVAGATYYGMTVSGGPANAGVIFKMNADNTGYTVLHFFQGGAGDGAQPVGSVVVSDGVMYGATRSGGAANAGTLFRMNLDGTGFALVHSFDASSGDGAALPAGTPVLFGSALYIMTSAGGFGNGTIYKVGIDGSNPTVMHYFTGGTAGDGIDAGSPTSGADLTLVGNRLLGTTAAGGKNSLGAILGINTDSSDYRVEYNFTGGPNDGAHPGGGLLYSDGSFFGTTESGGAYGLGTIFEFTPIPEPSTLLLTGAAGLGAYLVRGWRRRARAG